MNADHALTAPSRVPSRATSAPMRAADRVRPPGAGGVSATAPLSLHVERLVLQGLPLQPRDGARVEAAFRGELGRLVAARPLLAQQLVGGAFDRLRLDAIHVGSGSDPEQLGRALAGALLRGMAR